MVGNTELSNKFMGRRKPNLNPTQSDVRINTDGTIASVYFDFIFLIDGKEQNRGSEIWVLVKGADGWKIATIVQMEGLVRLS